MIITRFRRLIARDHILRDTQPGSLDASLDAEAAWLEKAIALNPSASWVYLLGNHDCHPRMQTLLTSISDRHPTFDWSPTFCCIICSPHKYNLFEPHQQLR